MRKNSTLIKVGIKKEKLSESTNLQCVMNKSCIIYTLTCVSIHLYPSLSSLHIDNMLGFGSIDTVLKILPV